jgi:hypothetical protein
MKQTVQNFFTHNRVFARSGQSTIDGTVLQFNSVRVKICFVFKKYLYKYVNNNKS